MLNRGRDGIRDSVHDFWAFNIQKYNVSMFKIATRAEGLLHAVRDQMFPHIPLPKVEPVP